MILIRMTLITVVDDDNNGAVAVDNGDQLVVYLVIYLS